MNGQTILETLTLIIDISYLDYIFDIPESTWQQLISLMLKFQIICLLLQSKITTLVMRGVKIEDILLY